MRFKLSMAAMAACAATALMAGAASANVTYYPYGVGAPTLPVVTNFSTDTVGSGPTHAPLGWSWSGNASVSNSRSSTTGAEPAIAGGIQPWHVNYLDVSKGETETLTIPASAKVEDINIYAGSLDSFNKVTFDLAGGSTATYTGVTLASLTTAKDSGNQKAASSNGIFNFTFSKPVTEIIFQSPTGNSFEIASIAAQFTSGIPEPSEWLMLTFGVAMIGAFARRKRSFAGAAAFA